MHRHGFVSAPEYRGAEPTGWPGRHIYTVSLFFGNTIKYLWRWKNKGGIEDLKKAQWYQDRLISELENERKST